MLAPIAQTRASPAQQPSQRRSSGGGAIHTALNFSPILTKSVCLLRQGNAARRHMMNRYLLFTYYAGRSWGGMKDFLDSFDSVAEALENLLPEPSRYFQIVDRDTLQIVKEGLTIFKDCDPQAFSRE